MCIRDSGARWARRARALSSECPFYEKKVELVGALFSILRRAYMEQYEAKQLDGAALAVCMEGLSSGACAAPDRARKRRGARARKRVGAERARARAERAFERAGEEYLYDHPIASPTGAFELELDVLLYELPPPSPAWLPYLLMLPSVGRALWRNQIFRRTYVVTEALAAYIHAHDELRKLCAPDPRKAALLRDAVEPALHRARLRLQEHRLRYWSLTTLQINLLTARAAIDLKRKQARRACAPAAAVLAAFRARSEPAALVPPLLFARAGARARRGGRPDRHQRVAADGRARLGVVRRRDDQILRARAAPLPPQAAARAARA